MEYNVLDAPKIQIKGIAFPNNVSFEDKFAVEFILSKESASNPRNIKIALIKNNFKKIWNLERLSEDRRFVINLRGDDLKKGDNKFSVIVNYEDDNGKDYEAQETFFVELVNVSFIQNILLTGNNIMIMLGNLTLTSWFLIIMGILFVFIIVARIILGRGNS